jgi:hypothetical protein
MQSYNILKNDDIQYVGVKMHRMKKDLNEAINAEANLINNPDLLEVKTR